MRYRSGRGDGDRLDRQLVTEAAEPAIEPSATRASTEVWRKRLAGGGVGEVDLDHHAVERAKGVRDRPGRVREGTGVDDHRRRLARCGVDGVDEVPFVVGLDVAELETVALRRRCRCVDVLAERLRAVDRGLALAEQVEIGPRDEQHKPPVVGVVHRHVAASISSKVARTWSSPTPRTTSTPFSPSRTKVRSCAAFLSPP